MRLPGPDLLRLSRQDERTRRIDAEYEPHDEGRMKTGIILITGTKYQEAPGLPALGHLVFNGGQKFNEF